MNIFILEMDIKNIILQTTVILLREYVQGFQRSSDSYSPKQQIIIRFGR